MGTPGSSLGRTSETGRLLSTVSITFLSVSWRMGQHSSHLGGKASCHPAILACAAWRRDAVASMYQRWLDGGANFLIDDRAFADLLGMNTVSASSSSAGSSGTSASSRTISKLFKVFDPEQTGMADAYEAMLAVALCSRMETQEKAQFAMLLYNFDAQSAPRLARVGLFSDGGLGGVGTGRESKHGEDQAGESSLSIDELTLMLRTAVVGASRVDEQVVAPEIVFFEKLASEAWDFASKGRVGVGRKRLGADERMPQGSVSCKSISLPPCSLSLSQLSLSLSISLFLSIYLSIYLFLPFSHAPPPPPPPKLVEFLGKHDLANNFLVYFEQVLCQVHISDGYPSYGVFQDANFPAASSSLYCNPDRRRSSCASRASMPVCKTC